MLLNFKLIGISVILLVPSINYGQKMDKPILLDLEANMKKMEIILLSQLNADIKYVRFDTKGDIFFTPSYGFETSGNQIIVANEGGCLLYDFSGHFISRIGKVGRGPEEYSSADLIGFDQNQHIYIRSLYDLFEYKTDGSFVKKYNKIFLINDKYYMYGGGLINDFLVLGHVLNQTGKEKFKALIVNKLGEVKNSFINYELYNPDRPSVDGWEGKRTNVTRFNNTIYYKEFYNDTLFSLNDKYELIPRYSFNLGKFKEPLSNRAKFVLQRDMGRFIYLSFVYQTDKYLFLDCEFGNQFPAKRLTIRQYPNSTKTTWYNTTSVIGIYSKMTRSLVFCKPSNGDNPLFSSGIYNDIDAGPRFFPAKQINDSTMAMWIDAKQLKEHVGSADFKKSEPKFPEQKKKLEELANSLTEFDNPVLMLVKL